MHKFLKAHKNKRWIQVINATFLLNFINIAK